MRIIESHNVDLIEPFPLSEIQRFLGWLHCYRTMFEVDGDPQTIEDKTLYYTQMLPQVPSWGVIDKNNQLNYKHEAPLVGIVFLQPGASNANCYVHLASTRRAWGSGLMDEAAQVLLPKVFENYPLLQRISGAILNNNKPAKAFAKRMGFKQDGLLKDFVTQQGIARSVAHFGILRREVCLVAKPQPLEANPSSSTTKEQAPELIAIPS
jgi:RimJ/RimL family protein N-acetyltransferase